MTKILVTGATGFVGRHIVNALLKSDVSLTLVVRTGKEHEYERCMRVDRIISTPDLFSEDESWWEDICHGIDTVIHSAWYMEPKKYLNSSKNIDCLVGTLAIAKGAATAGVRRFLGIGTCFEYDLYAGEDLSINSPLHPTSSYAAAKISTFLTLSQWLPSQSVEFLWCRLFYLYGEGESESRLVPYIRKQLINGEPAKLTSGTQVRDFLDVKRVGEKIAEAAYSDVIGVVNICSGIPITVREIAEKIADEYGRRELLEFSARPDNQVDPPRVVGVPNYG
ncbi:NAD-dependent epimerase/dehydratase family protein [Vreelandella lionensis]|uniref:NAD-dependent epimerase/dehydratase family protein n=1 Tax=Vreelandella lionensis TaxID=1144478 RepID=A0ABW8BWV7_9GAMM